MASSTMPALELAFGTIMFWGGGTKMPCAGVAAGGCIAGGSGTRGSIGVPMPATGNACVGCIDIPNIHGLGNCSGAGGVITGGESIAGGTGIMTGTSAGTGGECLGGAATGVWSSLVCGCLACRPRWAWARGVQGFPHFRAAKIR